MGCRQLYSYSCKKCSTDGRTEVETMKRTEFTTYGTFVPVISCAPQMCMNEDRCTDRRSAALLVGDTLLIWVVELDLFGIFGVGQQLRYRIVQHRVHHFRRDVGERP